MIRTHQLPAYSPLSWDSVVKAATDYFRYGHAATATLAGVLRARYDAEHVALCDSGTSALRLALEHIRGGNESQVVALPAFGCFDLATAAVGARSRIRFYDVDPETLTPDYDSLVSALRSGAGTVVLQTLYGMPYAYEELHDLCAPYGARIIEDVAQGHGAHWKGRLLGSLGPMTVLSFSRGKGWTAGSGGALLMRGPNCRLDTSLAAGAPTASVLFGAALLAAFSNPRIYGIPASIPWLRLGETRYKEPVAPRALPPAAAAVLLAARQLADQEASHRHRAGDWFHVALRSTGYVIGVNMPRAARPGYLRFPIRVRGGLDGLGDRLPLRLLGVAQSYPVPLYRLPYVRSYLAPGQQTFVGADELIRDLVTLPTHSLMKPHEVRGIVSLIAASRGSRPAPLPFPQQ
jgi:perosamine synthetase